MVCSVARVGTSATHRPCPARGWPPPNGATSAPRRADARWPEVSYVRPQRATQGRVTDLAPGRGEAQPLCRAGGPHASVSSPSLAISDARRADSRAARRAKPGGVALVGSHPRREARLRGRASGRHRKLHRRFRHTSSLIGHRVVAITMHTSLSVEKLELALARKWFFTPSERSFHRAQLQVCARDGLPSEDPRAVLERVISWHFLPLG